MATPHTNTKNQNFAVNILLCKPGIFNIRFSRVHLTFSQYTTIQVDICYNKDNYYDEFLKDILARQSNAQF